MVRDHLTSMAHNDAAAHNDNLHALTDQTPGYRITVRVEIDGTISLDLTNEVPQLPKRRTSGKWA